MNKRLCFVTLLILSGVCFSGLLAQSQEFDLTILYSNDFHGANMRLLAKRAAVVKRIRAENTHAVLLVDEGDIFGRGRYAKKFFGELEFAVYNEMRYDAIVLGNHEFKAVRDISAQKILLARIRQARFAVLCGNVITENSRTYLDGVKPYIIKEFDGVKVGLLGLTSTKINSYPQTKGWRCLDPVITGEKLLAEMADKADIIIALTHIGFDLDRVFAASVNGLSAIIGGDSHTLLFRPLIINNIPIVQAGNNGYYLGKLDLTFKKNGPAWRLHKVKGRLIDLEDDKILPDPAILKIINDYLKHCHRAAVIPAA
jgi:2',3'-cyclic-nucleotide 2'-phosphodiesterase (5'-nucleotidase family)